MVECGSLSDFVVDSIHRALVYLASAAQAAAAGPTNRSSFAPLPIPHSLSASRSTSWIDTQCLAWWFDGRFWVSGTEVAMAGFAQCGPRADCGSIAALKPGAGRPPDSLGLGLR